MKVWIILSGDDLRINALVNNHCGSHMWRLTLCSLWAVNHEGEQEKDVMKTPLKGLSSKGNHF